MQARGATRFNVLGAGTIEFDGGEVDCVVRDMSIAGAALETAVLNLLDNAVKYSSDRPQVEVEAGANGDGQAFLRVRDHGVVSPAA